MARIRSIKPEFWTDEKVVSISPLARLLFIGLWNFVDDEGRGEYSPLRLKMQILPADNVDVHELLEEIRRTKLIVVYSSEDKQYFEVRGFAKHQKIDRRSESKLPAPPNSPEDSAELGADQGREGIKDTSSLRSDVAPAPKPARRKTSIENDWQLSERNRQDAERYGINGAKLGIEAEKFRDHHLKTGSVFKDWDAAWRTWCQRAPDFAPRGTGPPEKRTQSFHDIGHFGLSDEPDHDNQSNHTGPAIELLAARRA